MSEQRPRWAWLFFAQLALLIIASVLATTGHFPLTVFQRSPLDKAGHLVMYGGLSFFGVAFFGRSRAWQVVIILLVGATLEEFSQRAFPTRTFDLGDLAMNVIGISVFGAAAAAGLAARFRKAGRMPLAATPRIETNMIERREREVVDTKLRRQCDEEELLRREVAEADRVLVLERVATRHVPPMFGPLEWGFFLFGFLFIASCLFRCLGTR